MSVLIVGSAMLYDNQCLSFFKIFNFGHIVMDEQKSTELLDFKLINVIGQRHSKG